MKKEEDIHAKEYIDIIKLNSPERKLLMLVHILNKSLFYNIKKKENEDFTSEEVNEILNEDKVILSKIHHCSCFNPFFKYLKDTSSLNIPLVDYTHLFNYETLFKINTCMYTNLIICDNENYYFNTEQILIFDLEDLINFFKNNDLYVTNRELFNKFIELNKKFPRILF